MTIKVGDNLKTKDGKSVRIIATDALCLYPIIGLVTCEENRELCLSWTLSGRALSDDEMKESDFDLIIPPKPQKSLWVNWYNGEEGYDGYSLREEADECSDPGRTHVLEIITEDGKPVDVKIHEVEE